MPEIINSLNAQWFSKQENDENYVCIELSDVYILILMYRY